jgi:hypothetical protein
MQVDQEIFTVREAVGIFSRPKDLQFAIDELLSSGFDRAELSLLASESAVEEKLGHRYEKVSDLEDDPKVPRVAYVSTEAIGEAQGGLIGGLMFVGALTAAGGVVASGGTLAAAIIGTVLAGGAGGLIGSILAKWVGDQHGEYLHEQVDRGGLLLWVRTPDTKDETRAVEILRRHSGSDVHVHSLPIPDEAVGLVMVTMNTSGPKERQILEFLNQRIFDQILHSTKASSSLKKAVRYTIRRLKQRDAAGMIQYYWSAIVGTDRSIRIAAKMRAEGFSRPQVANEFKLLFNDEFLRSP